MMPFQNNHTRSEPEPQEPSNFDQFVAQQNQRQGQSAQPSTSEPVMMRSAVDKDDASPLFWIALAAIILIGGGLIAYFALRPQRADPAAHRFTDPVEYYFYAPQNYTDTHAWPLMIGIHGSGGSGLDCWNMWQEYADREGYLLLCPTLSDANGGWYQSDGENKLTSALYHATFDYNVESQHFLVGFSAGAQFVQGYAFDYPRKVKAVAVLSAGNYMPPSRAAGGIPFLVAIGSRDDQGAIAMSLQFSQALADNGSSVDYWLLANTGHQVTDEARGKVLDFYRKVHGK